MSKRQPDAAGLLAFLWDRFDAETASDEDLAYLSAASEEAANMAFKLSDHVAGIGCLIDYDRGAETRCGSLQDSEQASLLFRLADEIAAIGHMASIGSESESRLRHRISARLDAGKSRRIRTSEQSSTLEEV
ncbi:hypothetical protein WS87_05415 [Burkholderia sp. MSMB0856]|uniref:hypothetical protein n=1 Tax=Burkholderia sp. MSMB0856 TaxID=1637869 RepID=UPI0007573CA0|nr:hypothetical protein [Burkholderia sp. MSMB0856]AOJ86145.1 hypothetical protein WS87_05415 [Burkholderia sp. MSMB0856]KVH28346.1 hypothetical protein WS87_28385 [Burkholderia sp. MSMB0856]